jgi:hypothetical protein
MVPEAASRARAEKAENPTEILVTFCGLCERPIGRNSHPSLLVWPIERCDVTESHLSILFKTCMILQLYSFALETHSRSHLPVIFARGGVLS